MNGNPFEECNARSRYVPANRGEYVPPKTLRRTDIVPEKNHAAKTPSINEVRAALQEGPMTRDALAKRFNTSRGEIAKPIYALRKKMEVVEEDDTVSLVSLVAEASAESPEPPVLGPTGLRKEEAVRRVFEALQERAGAWERGWEPLEAPGVEPFGSASATSDIEAALRLILAELPGLLRDREKLQKLREVLG